MILSHEYASEEPQGRIVTGTWKGAWYIPRRNHGGTRPLIERNLTMTVTRYAGKATKPTRGKHGPQEAAMHCDDCEGAREYAESTGPGVTWFACEQHVARLIEGEEDTASIEKSAKLSAARKAVWDKKREAIQ